LLGLDRIEFHSRCTFGNESGHLLGGTAGVSGLLWKPAFCGLKLIDQARVDSTPLSGASDAGSLSALS
jgi:hypothetical protein